MLQKLIASTYIDPYIHRYANIMAALSDDNRNAILFPLMKDENILSYLSEKSLKSLRVFSIQNRNKIPKELVEHISTKPTLSNLDKTVLLLFVKKYIFSVTPPSDLQDLVTRSINKLGRESVLKLAHHITQKGLNLPRRSRKTS